MNLNQVTLPTFDYEASVDFYRRMGFRQIVGSPPRYARFECTTGDATFSLHAAEPGTAVGATVIYFETPDLDAEVQRLQTAGFVFTQLPQDQPWLWREAYLRDPSGHLLCLFQAGAARRHPPWRLQS